MQDSHENSVGNSIYIFSYLGFSFSTALFWCLPPLLSKFKTSSSLNMRKFCCGRMVKAKQTSIRCAMRPVMLIAWN